ncbi:MAG: hypothetical protein AAF899_06710 [Pseudomonadota bacterium]
MSETAERMRELADAVKDGDGCRFQPIFPETLRVWACEIEELQALNKALQEERDFGAAETFCGVPMAQAVRIVSAVGRAQKALQTELEAQPSSSAT